MYSILFGMYGHSYIYIIYIYISLSMLVLNSRDRYEKNGNRILRA